MRLTCEVNLLGRDLGLARRGRRDARGRARTGTSSTSRRCPRSAPVPGLAVYAAAKHARARLHRLAPGRPARRGHPDHGPRALPGRRRHAAPPRARPRAGRRDQLVRAAPAHARTRWREHAVALLDSKKLVRVDPALARMGRARDGDARAARRFGAQPSSASGAPATERSDERRMHGLRRHSSRHRIERRGGRAPSRSRTPPPGKVIASVPGRAARARWPRWSRAPGARSPAGRRSASTAARR